MSLKARAKEMRDSSTVVGLKLWNQFSTVLMPVVSFRFVPGS